ncbi:alpha/beta hydrolase [Sphaerisporangium corydalis]|uniref:Alpha/beta hydrolase n=1 Tax=Sphaerisporangium corydalis TaxID=1441875 RepID=A0ABV9E6Y0_9ACTN|nr:alpha/beta hydrolase [Sphaerisporangium corydalis]
MPIGVRVASGRAAGGVVPFGVRVAAGLLAVAAFLPALTSLAQPAHAGTSAGHAVDTRAPRVEERPCPVPVPGGTRCGFLVVPERRAVPAGREIRVGYAVHRSTAADRKPDPVVYSGGGPGSPSIQLTGFLTRMPLGRDRDVVVIEQRGGRWSEPRLDCPEIARALVGTLTLPGQSSDPAERGLITANATACHDRLTRQGVDLRGYVTTEMAADVVDLRHALGYDRWNLFGVGHSTRTMTAVAAADPQGTRSVVLDSFLPGQVRYHDQARANLAGTLANLGRRWRGLPARFAAMVERLNKEPARLDTADPLTGRPLTVRLTGDDVATILTEAMREADVLPVVPALVDGVAAGDDRPLQVLADRAGGALKSHEFGLYYAVMCQEEAPLSTFADQGHPRLFTTVAYQAVCAAWHLPSLPATTPAPSAASPSAFAASGSVPSAYGAPASGSSTAPVLVVGGQYDPVTAPGPARTAASALPGARFVEFAGVGHAVFLSSGCGRRTISAFVADPAATGAPCDPRRAAYQVWRQGEFHLTPAVHRISTGAWWLLIPFVLFFLTSAAQVVAGTRVLARRGMVRKVPSVVALTTVAGLAGVVFTLLTVVGVHSVARSDEAALAVGVPSAVTWYGALAVLSAALSVVALVRGHYQWRAAIPAATAVLLLVWGFVFF